jgi:hypothetical protein
VKRATRSNDGKEATIAWIVGSSSSAKGDEPRGARRDAAAATVLPRTHRSAPPPSRAPAVACIAAERTDRYAAPSGTTTTGGGSPARGKRRERLATTRCVREVAKEDGTDTDANGDDAESEPGASQSGESVPMPRAGERAFLGPGHSALHQRVLHANVGRTAGEPQRLRVPEKRTLGGHLARILYRLRA